MATRIFYLFLIIQSYLCAQTTQPSWSNRIASSFMQLYPDTIAYPNEAKSYRWNYEQGLMLEAYYQMWLHGKNDKYKNYIKKNLDHYIRNDGSIATYKVTEFNIDNISPGKILLRAYDMFKEERFKRAADTLRRQLAHHPRTSEGGFWHKQIYPHQMWLDGLYMAEPFYTLYSVTFNDTAAFDDIANQFLLIKKHAYDKKTGLYFHGWDESKQQQWANKETGCSPNFWGRSLGWFAMALIDVLDYFPQRHPKRKDLEMLFQDFIESVLKQRDEKSKLWYQVVDKHDAPGNYLEASASAMFTYAIAKGVNKSLLPQTFAQAARESFEGIVKQFVTIDVKGNIFLNEICKVAGLGGNPYRNGSYEYYISEPRRTNDFKGYGPFLLAAIETEKLK